MRYNESNAWEDFGERKLAQLKSALDDGNSVYVIGTITESTTYTVTCVSAEHGTVSATPTTAAQGAEITVIATPDEGYELDTLTYTVDGSSTPVTITGNKFTMPGADVKVKATFKEKGEVFDVTFDYGEPGAKRTVTVPVASGSCAERPETPSASGWTFKGWFGYIKGELTKWIFKGETDAENFKITEDTTIYAKWSQNRSHDDDNRSTTTTSKPAKTGSWDSPVTDGTWTKGSDGKWMYKTNANFRDTWGYITYTDRLGKVQTGWFWFDANGKMVTGWVKINGNWFYFDETEDGTLGIMKQGWVTWNGGKYYLTETKDSNGGKMLANTTTPDGHVVDETGKMIR